MSDVSQNYQIEDYDWWRGGAGEERNEKTKHVASGPSLLQKYLQSALVSSLLALNSLGGSALPAFAETQLPPIVKYNQRINVSDPADLTDADYKK